MQCSNTVIYCCSLVNLLLLCVISFVGGAGVWAIVGEIMAGSLAFKSIIRATPSPSSALLRKIFDINTGMYSYPISAFTLLTSHCPVLWLYFLVAIFTPDLVVACSRPR